MNTTDFYDYLVRARRDLWAALEGLSDEVLARPVLKGERFHCIKDLVLHVPAVEDSWLHEDILRDTPVWETALGIQGAKDGPYFAETPLADLLDYWRAVEASTLAYLAQLGPEEEARLVTVPRRDGREEHFTVSGLLWHVMVHEVRHTAQVALLVRQADVKPPFLDLLNYLPTH